MRGQAAGLNALHQFVEVLWIARIVSAAREHHRRHGIELAFRLKHRKGVNDEPVVFMFPELVGKIKEAIWKRIGSCNFRMTRYVARRIEINGELDDIGFSARRWIKPLTVIARIVA